MSSSNAVDSGIRGTVALWPTCPVERPGQTCSKLVATTVDINGADGHRVTTAASDSQGRFSVALAPGTYSVAAEKTPGGLGMFSKPTTVVVQPHQYATVSVILDTGIR